RSKAQATAIACRNNLAQIAEAMAIYTADFGKYPGTRSSPIAPPNFASPDWQQIWDHRLSPYVLDSRKVFLCPADMMPPCFPPFPSTNTVLTNYTYGYNAYGTGVQSPVSNLGLGRPEFPETDLSKSLLLVSESQVVAPDDMIAVGDLTDIPSVFDTTIKPNNPPPYAGDPAARHNGGANMVFCDSHTEYGKQKEWIKESDTARRRWNNDHQPHPETW
ncbi:MAG TPA: H-X9-DG-CTERM domain-containing protein, partial [Verrucomicrobiae bacterium]|nr:H-X9-DG-CTERM domain-containing protein [Verrucomicrobiae bacterium]